MHHLGDVARADAARAAHDMDRILVAARGDQPDFGAFALDQRVRADGGPVREHLDLAAELLEGELEALGREAHRGDHAFGEVGRGRRGLGGGDGAIFRKHHAIGEGAADVNADKKPCHFLFPTGVRAGW